MRPSGDVERIAGYARQRTAAGDKRVASAGAVDREIAERGNAIDRVYRASTSQRATAAATRIGAYRQRDRGRAASNGIAELVLDGHLNGWRHGRGACSVTGLDDQRKSLRRANCDVKRVAGSTCQSTACGDKCVPSTSSADRQIEGSRAIDRAYRRAAGERCTSRVVPKSHCDWRGAAGNGVTARILNRDPDAGHSVDGRAGQGGRRLISEHQSAGWSRNNTEGRA